MLTSSGLPARSRATLFLPLTLLLVAAGTLTAKQPAWRFKINAGRSISSTIDVVNHCHAVHSFRVSTSPALGFVTFHGPVDFELAAAQKRTVDIEFVATNLEPRLYKGDIVVSCRDCEAEPRCAQSTELEGIEMEVVAPEGPAPDEEPALFDLTLDLFWRLAAVEAASPSQMSQLLAADPEQAAGLLGRFGIDTVSYGARVAGLAPVVPRFVFARDLEGLVARANKLGLRMEASLRTSPPMLYRGRNAALLVIFEPRATASGPTPYGHPVPAVFATGALLSPRWVRTPGVDAAELSYNALPLSWTPGVAISHTWCGNFESMVKGVAKLTYGGGARDRVCIPLNGAKDPKCTNLSPVSLPSCPGGTQLQLLQNTRPRPDPPVILASGYLVRRDKGPTIVVAVPVDVPP